MGQQYGLLSPSRTSKTNKQTKKKITVVPVEATVGICE